MTRYLIDTSVLIDASTQQDPAWSRLREMMASRDQVAVTAVQIAEFFSGLRPNQRPQWEEFFESLLYWSIDPLTARQAGIYRHDFARRGVSLATTDMLIAAAAWRYDAILVTNNAKDFPMTDIEILILRPTT